MPLPSFEIVFFFLIFTLSKVIRTIQACYYTEEITIQTFTFVSFGGGIGNMITVSISC